MSLDSDIALIGTGLAPLIAASHFSAQGKSVVLINPDFDFFLENSELPLDPLLPVGPSTSKIRRIIESLPEATLAELRPLFPGSVEFWSEASSASSASSERTGDHDFHDERAPHVRSRARLWTTLTPELEDLYVQASDEDLHPQILEGVQATSRFPGIARPHELEPGQKALLIPRLCDIDLTRYRNGVLEFVRERLGPERIFSEVSQIEALRGGLRFRHSGAPRSARIREFTLAFWTPRITPWIFQLGERPPLPLGIRLWEQWLLSSRSALSPDVVGIYDQGLAIWAEVEGAPKFPQESPQLLSALRAGELIPAASRLFQEETSWASRASFESLGRLCIDFLKWDRFSVRSMVPRAILEWAQPQLFELGGVRVLSGSDGPVVSVARNVRIACESLSGGIP